MTKRDYIAKLEVFDLNDSKENALKVAWWLIAEANKIKTDYKRYDPKKTIFRLMK